MNGQEDPRYDSGKSAVEMRKIITTLGKNTHKFIQEHNEICKKVEDIKYKDYMEQRFNCRSGQIGDGFQNIDQRSSVGQELRGTLLNLQRTTNNFIREHSELANRAEYLKYTDFVRQREKRNK